MAFDASAAMHSRFFRDVEALCRKMAPAVSLPQHHSEFEDTVRSLNMSPDYAKSFGSGAAEHVQNWWDQCHVTAADRQPTVQLVDPVALAELTQRHQIRAGATAYAACVQRTLVGILVSCTATTGQQLLLLKNYGAQMTLDHLILGESSKRNDNALAGLHMALLARLSAQQPAENLDCGTVSKICNYRSAFKSRLSAGQFGEGAKVEINRLVQQGCTVRYWTGNAAWAFEHRTTPNSSVPVLHVIVQPGSDLYDYVGMAVISKPNYKGQLLDVERFLFLQGQYTKISSPPLHSRKWSGMELLLDERHHSKVYIQSIFVAMAPNYKGFGINYTGDKTIFDSLGLGRDRDTLNDRFLVFGIPGMFADIEHNRNQQLPRMCQTPMAELMRRRTDYQAAIVELVKLMNHEGTQLKTLVDPFTFMNTFPNASDDKKQLAKGLNEYFRTCHPSALPICSKNAKSSLEQVDDLKYLGFEVVEVPETMYLLFQQTGLLQSREELWEIRMQEILAQPDPLVDLSAEQKAGYVKLITELETVCKKYVTPGQIVYRQMPAGNIHVLRGFTTHFVIDSAIVCDPAQVHAQLAAILDIQCQQPCQCLRKLLLYSMVNALSRQKGGPTKERVLNDILGGYIGASHYNHELPASTITHNRHHTANTGLSNTTPDDGPIAMDVCNSAYSNSSNISSAADQTTGVKSAFLNPANDSPAGAAAGVQASARPSAVRIVQEREMPITPGNRDPVVFHNGIQAALASVLRHSAGQNCSEGIMRSCTHPSAEGCADTVTVRICPSESKHTLTASSIKLSSCVVDGVEKCLYLPEGFDVQSWSLAQSHAAQQLYYLLERLHELMFPGVAPVNLYYDADDGCIAFNKGNKLWYNAYADKVYDQAPQSIRLFNWYITVCHELAHNFRKEHDEVFSDYLAHIALQHSKGFYALCHHYGIEMP